MNHAKCIDCGSPLQSKVAKYCVFCFSKRQQPCFECLTPNGGVRRAYMRKNPGDAQPVCPKCENARVVLVEGT